MISLLCALALADEVLVEQYSRVELQGTPIGWSLARETALDDGTFRSESHMVMDLRRGADVVRIEVAATMVEGPDGAPRTAEVHQALGSQATVQRWTFGDDGIAVVTEAGGRSLATTMPWRGGCVGPAATRRRLVELLDRGEPKGTWCVVDANLGPVAVDATYEVRGADLVPGTSDRATSVVWSAPGVGLPPSTSFVDARGVYVYAETEAMGMTMAVIAADRSVVDAAVGEVEALGQTLIRPDQRIPGARELDALTVRLSVPGHRVPDPPVTTAQTFRRRGDKVDVTVRVDGDFVSGPRPADVPDALGRSSIIDPEDPVIVALASELADAQLTGAALAEALRRGVYRFIGTKDLGSGLASASEVAVSRQGDCTEHAVLLAALLRARGVPARVAMGLVYVDDFVGQQGVFGYHMWTQALLETPAGWRWVDLDAVLDEARPFDATHLALAVSTLRDGQLASEVYPLASLPGKLEVEVRRVGGR